MLRLDQYIRFFVQDTPFIMSLDLQSASNEWVIRPERLDEVVPGKFKALQQLLAEKTDARLENNTVIVDIGWAQCHLITDGIALQPNWNGETLDGLLSATACLIAHTLSLLAETWDIHRFRCHWGKKIQYRKFGNWRAVELMDPLVALCVQRSEDASDEDRELIRLYEHLGLITLVTDIDDHDDLGNFLDFEPDDWDERLELYDDDEEPWDDDDLLDERTDRYWRDKHWDEYCRQMLVQN
ncbi:MAG TPA: hypothetical protein VJC05_01930 [Candidatus Andersenbacteria bacterium]|nr:hypothetical protein [Candidatus Andersenbacteria bacterium]